MTGSESTPDNPLPPRPPGFHGRDEELAWLRGLWDDATVRNNGPRLAVIVAESGIGKTRLAQALYQQLSADPVWDPPESRYWPDAFQSRHDSLRVNPDLSDHHPAGPPRFLWLGMRWQPPNARNVEERSCPLPDVRAKLMAHVETAWNHAGRWKQLGDRALRGIRRDAPEEILTEVAEQVVPFAGLFSKMVRGGLAAMRDLEDRDSTPLDREHGQHTDAAEDLQNLLREVLQRGAGGGRPLPVVVLLDDAQWIDALSRRLVAQLWSEASQKGWPLLLIVTHWEAEWRRLRMQAAGGTATTLDATWVLASISDAPQVSTRLLSKADFRALGAYLDSRLPGLTPAQRTLLLQKADGNFLTLVENIGALLRQPARFTNRDSSQALSPAGERLVNDWESDRARRIEQFFQEELDSSQQDLLSWGGRLGQCFLHDVVAEFAEEEALESLGRPATSIIRECVDPLAILEQFSNLGLTEFRDRTWHKVAQEHFSEFHAQHEPMLLQILQRHVGQFVRQSFDDLTIRLDPLSGPFAVPVGSALQMSSADRQVLLSMAMDTFPLSVSPGGGLVHQEPGYSVALQARILACYFSFLDRRWNSLTEVSELLVESEHTQSIESMLRPEALRVIKDIVSFGKERSLLHKSVGERQQSLDSLRQAAEQQFDLNVAAELSTALLSTGASLKDLGDIVAATSLFMECVELNNSRLVCVDQYRASANYSLGVAHRSLALIAISRGELANARIQYQRSIDCCRDAIRELPLIGLHKLLCYSLEGLSDLCFDSGGFEQAEAGYCEIRQILVSAEETIAPALQELLARATLHLASVREAMGDPESARELEQEAVKLFRESVRESDCVYRRFNLSAALQRVGNFALQDGKFSDALDAFRESLALRRDVWIEALADPHARESTRDLLRQTAVAARASGDAREADRLESELLAIPVHDGPLPHGE